MCDVARADGAEVDLERLSGGLDRPTLVVAGVATLGLIMAVLDTTIVNVALDTLSQDLDASLSTIQWVTTGYLLSLASVTPLSGWVTERFGSKRTWIAAIALFAGGSALCALASSAAELIAFRVLQGLGGGMLLPVGFTLIAQVAGPRRVGRALALVGVPILLGPIFGPIAFGLSETESYGGIGEPIAYAPIIAGLALLALFGRHSLGVPRPLIDVRLFRARGFRAAAILTVLLGAALFGTLLLFPLYYQVDRGETALHAGLLIAPQGLGAAVMLPIAGRLTDRLGAGPVVVAGCSILALATVPFAFVTDDTPYALLGAVLFVRGLGLGASVQPSAAAAYAVLEPSQIPRATAAINTLRQIGASIGTAFLAVVLERQATNAMSSAGAGGGGLLGLAIAPAIALLRAQRDSRRAGTAAQVLELRPDAA